MHKTREVQGRILHLWIMQCVDPSSIVTFCLEDGWGFRCGGQ